MVRTLTSAASTEAAKQTGAEPVYVLEIQWGGGTGTKYYATETISSPITAEARVLQWGNIQTTAEPGRVGGHGQTTIEMADPDYAFKTLVSTKPGPANKPAYIHLWYRGTSWDDRVTLFGGVIASPSSWSLKDQKWSLTLKGLEALHDKTIGTPYTRQVWTEINCNECEGDIIPIVYGSPYLRVPCCAVDRPGQDVLAFRLTQFGEELYLSRSAVAAGFTVDSEITLYVGYASLFETITGCFCDPLDRTKFEIYSRNSIYAEGNVDTLYGSGGFLYVTIPEADVPYPATSLAGHYICFLVSGTWTCMLVTLWELSGGSIIVCPVGQTGVNVGTPYKLLIRPATIVTWEPGTPVHEAGTWTYVVNFLPSEEVVRVEAHGTINHPLYGHYSGFLTYDSAFYTVNLDNKTWNDRLGRAVDDPGVTTVTLSTGPVTLGFDDPKVYVSLKGCNGTNVAADPALTNPVDVAEDLLTNEFLGAIPAGAVNSASFTAAAADVDQVSSFAITEKRKLHELVGNVLEQANCLYFWDQGKATTAFIARPSELASKTATLSVSLSQMATQSLEIERYDLTEAPTELLGRFKTSYVSDPVRIMRTSPDMITAFGKNRDEVEITAYQYPSSVALTLEQKLLHRLENHGKVKFDTFLQAVAAQPGDVISLTITDGNSGTLFSDKRMRVTEVSHRPGDLQAQQAPNISITAEFSDWAVEVDSATFSDDPCDQPVLPPPPPTTTLPPTTTSPPTTTLEPTTTSPPPPPTTTVPPPPTTTVPPTTTEPPTTTAPSCDCSPGGSKQYQCVQSGCAPGSPPECGWVAYGTDTDCPSPCVNVDAALGPCFVGGTNGAIVNVRTCYDPTPGCPTTTVPPTTTAPPTTTLPPTTTSVTTTEPPTTTASPTTTEPPTTTSAPTTTSSPTTTAGPTTTAAPTTTEDPGCGTCQWACFCMGEDCGWISDGYFCTGGCGCNEPLVTCHSGNVGSTTVTACQ